LCISQDMYAQDSIDFLRKNGLNFYTHQSKGIDVHRFGELMIASGKKLNVLFLNVLIN
jgi:CCR4-NOT transcription complex subunit 7/8